MGAIPEGGKLLALRIVLLALIAADFVMVVVRVALYPPVVVLRGGLLLVLEPIALLVFYAGFVVWATRNISPDRQKALSVGTFYGIVSALVSICHIVLENYVTVSPRTTALVTFAFIVGMFLPWAAAAYRTVRRGGTRSSGVLAAVWGSVVCMVLTVTFGYLELLTSLSRLERLASGSPDFARSGWTDLRAFAIVDTFGAGFSHLLIGPVVAAVLGGIAATTAARFIAKGSPPATSAVRSEGAAQSSEGRPSGEQTDRADGASAV